MTKFKSPIWILEGGLNFRSVNSADESLAYLHGWRGARAAIYDHALRSMEAAVRGEIDPQLAQEIFRRFAASEGVLAEADAA